jgi:TRAP transporter 4TM/12TM fusion protein
VVCASDRAAPIAADAGDDRHATPTSPVTIAADAGAVRAAQGPLRQLVVALLVAMSLVHLYAAVVGLAPRVLRPVHVGFTLVLVFLLIPARGQRSRLPGWPDVVCAVLAVATIAHVLAGGAAFWDRAAQPRPADGFFGVVFLLLVAEACRRTAGWPTVVVIAVIAVLAFAGAALSATSPFAGVGISGLAARLYQTTEGVFGDAVAASSTLIILFTMFAAFLEHAGALRFLRDWSMAATSHEGARTRRTFVLASMLVGCASGSAVVAAQAGASAAAREPDEPGVREAAGGLVAAAGLGALVTPPVLGAAGILAAEFLRMRYVDVLLMATVPAILWYLSLLMMAEIDARKSGPAIEARAAAGANCAAGLARRYAYHFAGIVALVTLLAIGYSAVVAVLGAMLATCATLFFRGDIRMGLRAVAHALRDGAEQVLGVAATCAAAGIAVGMVTMTDTAPKVGALVVAATGGSLPLVAGFIALGIGVAGLALPVAATYILAAILAAPALGMLGVPAYAVHMFIFCCAALSGLWPLWTGRRHAVAATAEGAARRTTLRAWKYTLPIFVVPLAFVLDPAGVALLLKVPAGASWQHVAWIALKVVAAIVALGSGIQCWLLRACTQVERWLLIACGLLLVYPAPQSDWAGLAGFVALIAWQRFVPARTRPA